MNITTKLIPAPTARRSGIKNNGVKFIVCHDTGNDGASAMTNANYYYSSRDAMQASAHYFVDDKYVINVIPENEKAWHVRYDMNLDNTLYGDDANDIALGIELCYSTKGLFDSKKAYQNYVELIASLCKKYNLDPKKHLIAHATLDPSRRSDPINAFSKIGKTWDAFIADVVSWRVPIAPEETIAVQVPKSKVEKVLAFMKTI